MADKTPKRDDSKKLQEIREAFTRYRAYWKPIYDDGKKDMDCLTPGVGPWDPQERESRKEAGRQCLTLDELHQYVNQLINDVRMNKIGIKVDPKGNGATSLTASTRQGIIRNIEFESNAQTAYTTAFEGAAQRGYGFAKVITEFASPDSWDQVIKIVRIPNPDTVLMDPNCVEATCSDAEGCFVFTVMRKADFKRKYPWAQKTSFTADDQKFAPDWFPGDDIIVAEWWEIEKTYRTKLCLPAEAIGLLPKGQEPPRARVITIDGEQKEAVSVYEDELPKNHGLEALSLAQMRRAQAGAVHHQWRRILETNPQAGKYIRIIPCFGKEMFVTETGGSKRKYLSLIRLARDAFMYYCFLRTQQAEEAQMTPKVPWVGLRRPVRRPRRRMGERAQSSHRLLAGQAAIRCYRAAFSRCRPVRSSRPISLLTKRPANRPSAPFSPQWACSMLRGQARFQREIGQAAGRARARKLAGKFPLHRQLSPLHPAGRRSRRRPIEAHLGHARSRSRLSRAGRHAEDDHPQQSGLRKKARKSRCTTTRKRATTM
jgi:hypothetical protein